MANNNFGSAPNSSGGFRSVSRQIAGVLALGNRRGNDSLSYREQSALSSQAHQQSSALSSQAHQQSIQSNVVSSVLANQSKAKETRMAGRNSRKEMKLKGAQAASADTRSESAAESAHRRGMESNEHTANVLHGVSANPQIKGINLKSGSATFNSHPQQKGQQMGGVGGDTSGQSATPLD